MSKMRWTVDYEEDLIFIQEIFKELSPDNEIFYKDDVLALLEKKPELTKLNDQYIRDEAYFTAIEELNKEKTD